jgi:predicted PurR-regulated permease PerM
VAAQPADHLCIVGALTGIGLWLVGVPAPLALGLLAGLLEFVPYIDPVLAAVPGLLLALSVAPEVLLYTLLVYLGVQQLESNFVLPLVQREVLELPPALVIFSVVGLGVILGTLGWIFAAPLTVLLVVVIGKAYVREALGTRTKVPGDSEDQALPPVHR